jgi:membrane fusion protein (multidrug efflux system)
VTVDPSTGAVALRARFPNPKGLLLPGMYVRAVVSQAEQRGAFLLPPAAVTHDPKGAASVLVVGAGDTLVKRTVTDHGLRDNRWVITGGLKAGEKVVVEGSSKVQPGQKVRTVASNGTPADSAIIDRPPLGAGGDSKGGSSKKSGGASGIAQ